MLLVGTAWLLFVTPFLVMSTDNCDYQDRREYLATYASTPCGPASPWSEEMGHLASSSTAPSPIWPQPAPIK